jgi:drug/metabolite transporter (DMT)-like permease
MTTGALFLPFVSLAAGENRYLPERAATWLAWAYLVVVGSVVVFSLFLYVLKHWTASATSYQFVLLPFVTVALSAWLTGEQLTPSLVLGGVLVLAGVWVGALMPAGRRGAG